MYILKNSATRTMKISVKNKNHSMKHRNEKYVELPNNKYVEEACKIFQNLCTF